MEVPGRHFGGLSTNGFGGSKSLWRCFDVQKPGHFRPFWREKGFKSDSWNTLFINHVRKEWAKFTNRINDKNKPKKMIANWEPDPSCYDVLKLAKISKKFAMEQLVEFRIFWIDSNEIMTSWNSKFIQHVKYKWYKKNPQASGIISRLNDKEWAVDVEH